MSSWRLAKLGMVTIKVGSGATPRGGKDSYKPSGTPLVRSQNVHFGGFRDDGLAFIDEDQADALKSVEVQPDDVLLNITGASIGRVALAPSRMAGARVNQHVCIIRPKPELQPSFLRWYLTSPNIQHFIFGIQTGVTRQALTKEQILAFDVPLPPVEVQREIIAEIEKQFSRLDEAVSSLKRIQANLKHYKAAVLKAAVEGKLTEQWRKEHPDIEPADQLLKRILAERRDKWEAEELAKMKAKGIKPKDDSWKKKYKEPAGPETANLSELPEGWVWATYDQAGYLNLGRQRAPKYHSGPNMRQYLRVQNVFEDRIDLSDVMEMDFPPSDFEKYELKSGDMLLNEGQSPELLGRPAIYRGELPGACFTNTLIRFRAVPGVSVEFALLVSRYYMRARRFLEEGTITTNIAHLSLGRLATIEFPLPSFTEQQTIVAEAERLLSVAEELEATVDANLKRTERLRQTILQQAFSGGRV